MGKIHIVPGLKAATLALALLPAGAPASADDKKDDRPTPPSWLLIVNGVSAPRFELRNAIVESICVETAVDSDLDGQLDRVHL